MKFPLTFGADMLHIGHMTPPSFPKNILNRLENGENALWQGKSKEPAFTAERVRVSLGLLLAAAFLPFMANRFPAELPWTFQLAMAFGAIALCIAAIMPFIAKAIQPAPRYAVTNRRVLGESRLFIFFKKEWEFPITKDLIKGGRVNPDLSGSLDFSYDLDCTVNGRPVSCGFRHVGHVRRIEQMLVAQGAAPLPPEEYSRQGVREGRALLLKGISLALAALGLYWCAGQIGQGEEGWASADAVITGYAKHTTDSGGIVWRPVLEFHTADGNREVSATCLSPAASIKVAAGGYVGSAPADRIGQSIGILYNPENPEQVVAKHDREGQDFSGYIKSFCPWVWTFAGLELAFALHACLCAAKAKDIIRSGSGLP